MKSKTFSYLCIIPGRSLLSIFPFIVFYGLSGISQNTDSLIAVARSRMLKDPRQAEEMLAPAVEISIRNRQYSDAVPLLHQLAILALLKGDNQKSNSLNREAMKYARLSRDEMLIGNSLTKLAKDYRKAAKPDSAVNYCLEAISSYAAVSAEGQSWACHSILGDIAFDASRLQDAEEHYLKAWEVVQMLNDKKDEFIVAGILQNFYVATREEEKYADIVEVLLQRNPYFSSDINAQNAHYQSLLQFNREQNESVEDLKKSISYLNHQNHPSSYLVTMSRLGNMLTRSGRLAEAFDSLQQAIRFASKSRPLQMSLYYQLFLNRKAANDLAGSLAYLDRYHAVKDSINSEAATAHIRELEVKYDTKEKELALLKEKETLNKRTVQRNLSIAGAGVILWFSLFGILFLWNKARMQRKIASQNEAIHRQKIQQLEQDKKILAMSSMIEGQEAERKRIAQDLHDGLGGLLSSVKAQLNLIQHHVEKLESSNLYAKANSLIDTASGELRRIAYNMMPTSLSRYGLKAALEDLSNSLTNEYKLDVDLQIFGLNGRVNETTEIMMYRIIQELSNNVVKHAHASKLLIQINKAEDEVFIVVEDNGIGMDSQRVLASKGIGMKSIESRVKYLNGSLDISSPSGKGTCITIHFHENGKPAPPEDISLDA